MLLAAISHELCYYKVTNSVIGVLTNDKETFSLVALAGFSVASLPRVGAAAQPAAQTLLVLPSWHRWGAKRHTRPAELPRQAGWDTRFKAQASACFKTREFFCVEMALL